MRVQTEPLAAQHSFLRDHKTIKGDMLFGLGLSCYDPQNHLAVIGALSEDELQDCTRPAFQQLTTSRTTAHEMGHCVLSSCSRTGRMLRDLGALQQGLCLVILKRMLKVHGRVWSPLSTYFDQDQRNPQIEKLIRATLRLDILAQEITSGWKVCQELFACIWTVQIAGTLEFGIAYATGRSGSELQRRLHTVSLLYDKSTIDEFERFLKSHVPREETKPGSRDLGHYVQIFCSLLQEARADPKISANCVALLEYMIDLMTSDKNNDRLTLADISMQIANDVQAHFNKGEREHIEAFQIYLQSIGGSGNMLEALAGLALASTIFTPRLSVDRFLDDSRKLTVGRIDAAISFLASHPFIRNLDSLSPEDIAREVELLQQMMGSVRLSSLHRVPQEQIIGTIDWTGRLLRRLGLRRGERNLIYDLMEAYCAVSWDKDRVAEERLRRFLPWWIHPLGRLAFALQRVLKKHSENARFIFGLFRAAGIRNWDGLWNFYELYHDVLGVLVTALDSQRLGPLVQLGMGPSRATMLLNQPAQSAASRLCFYRHVWGSLTDSLLRGRTATPIACVGCHVESRGLLGTATPKDCLVGRLFQCLAHDDNLLICCTGDKARFLRREDLKTPETAITIPFALRVQLLAEVETTEEASSIPAMNVSKRIGHHLRILRKRYRSDERAWTKSRESVAQTLMQLPRELTRIAAQL
jgi:hypothetical protein